ncbi:hypothetical protein F4804DRAFT_326548, partial [Jackrogersella minutella]
MRLIDRLGKTTQQREHLTLTMTPKSRSSGPLNLTERAEDAQSREVLRWSLFRPIRQLAPSEVEAVEIRSEPPSRWNLWCYTDDKGFCKQREANVNSVKDILEDVNSSLNKLESLGPKYFNDSIATIEKYLAPQNRLREVKRLRAEREVLYAEDFAIRLTLVASGYREEMGKCIALCRVNTTEIKRQVRRKFAKHRIWNESRTFRLDRGAYTMAGGESSPLRQITNSEDLEDSPSDMAVDEADALCWGGGSLADWGKDDSWWEWSSADRGEV